MAILAERMSHTWDMKVGWDENLEAQRHEEPGTFSAFCPPRKRSRASPNRDLSNFLSSFRSHTGFGQPLSPRWALNGIEKRLICHLIPIQNVDGMYSNQRGVLSSYTTHNCERSLRRRNVSTRSPAHNSQLENRFTRGAPTFHSRS